MDGQHGALQRRVSRLQRAGRLVCLASKNDAPDVVRVFEQRRAEMALHLDQLSGLEVHWQPKALSLRRLSEQLGLGTASFLFLDDSPAEVHAVRRALPEVLAVLVPSGDARAFARLVEHHWALDAWPSTPSTAEDALRTQSTTARLEPRRRVRAGGVHARARAQLTLALHLHSRSLPDRHSRCVLSNHAAVAVYVQKAARKAARRELRHLSLRAFLSALELRIEVHRPSVPLGVDCMLS